MGLNPCLGAGGCSSSVDHLDPGSYSRLALPCHLRVTDRLQHIYAALARHRPGTSRGFAFVSPAIAVGVGGVLVGEVITLQSVAGMTTMMLAAIVVCWQIGLAPSFWR